VNGTINTKNTVPALLEKRKSKWKSPSAVVHFSS
jgi:hypothetical protein